MIFFLWWWCCQQATTTITTLSLVYMYAAPIFTISLNSEILNRKPIKYGTVWNGWTVYDCRIVIEDCVFNDIQNNKDILLFKANDKKIASAISEDWIYAFERRETKEKKKHQRRTCCWHRSFLLLHETRIDIAFVLLMCVRVIGNLSFFFALALPPFCTSLKEFFFLHRLRPHFLAKTNRWVKWYVCTNEKKKCINNKAKYIHKHACVIEPQCNHII